MKKLSKSNKQIATQVKNMILRIANSEIDGLTLKGYSKFKRARVRDYRIIYTDSEDLVIIATLKGTPQKIY